MYQASENALGLLDFEIHSPNRLVNIFQLQQPWLTPPTKTKKIIDQY